MTSSDGFLYPAHMINSLEQFIGFMKGLVPIAEDTLKQSQTLVASSAGQTFTQFEISMRQLVNDLKAHIATAEAFGKTGIQGAQDMHAVDRRGAALFQSPR